MKNSILKTMLSASISLGAAQAVLAQETLRFADSLPATHLFTREVALPWMEAVTEATGGEVTFEHYPAQQLGSARDMLSLAQTGVADLAFVVPIYTTDELPLSGIYDLPGGPFTSCEGVEAFLDLATGDGILAREEYEPNGVRVLMAVVQPPFQVFTASRPIASIHDLEGLKLRSAGGAQDMTASALGIVPVMITAPETAEAISRGTIDGAILASVSVEAYGMTDLIQYATDGANFGSAALTWSISEERFQSFSPEVQEIMVQAGRDVSMAACQTIENDVAAAVDTWRDNGVTIVEFPADEQAEMTAMFDEIGREWAQALDERGRPGSEVLEAFHAALEAAQ
ncbi:MAG: TRAP-type C4-dicarboxylate transport system, periplasmic component [Rhodobacteraceae bacterium HLUCCA12]|nr:MAG: TRAP-type C4-dicarboxylate transport system, periplasmic component [Rhodobacteraceae bacterium HLUCCA12]